MNFLQKSIYLLLFLFMHLHSFGQEKKTTVLFNYGGFSDTVVALLSINILPLKDSSGNTNALVLITDNEGKTISKQQSKPKDLYGFNYGYYTIHISKPGYDVVKIENYFAVPDQVSNTSIQLCRGNDTIVFRTEPPEYLFPKNGTDSIYYDNGQLKELKTFKHDKLIEHYVFFEDGNLARKQIPLDETLTYLIEYYKPNLVKFIAVYNPGTTIGFRKEFYENGQLKDHLINTENGQKCWERLNENGEYLVREGQKIKH